MFKLLFILTVWDVLRVNVTSLRILLDDCKPQAMQSRNRMTVHICDDGQGFPRFVHYVHFWGDLIAFSALKHGGNMIQSSIFDYLSALDGSDTGNWC